MKYTSLLALVCCISMNIFSSEKNNKESTPNWKANLQELSPNHIGLLKEQPVCEYALIEKNEYDHHIKNVETLELKCRIKLYEQKITSMQRELEQKDLIIKQLQSHK